MQLHHPSVVSRRGGCWSRNPTRRRKRPRAMSKAAVNRYAAIALLAIAILSAIVLKLSLDSFVAEADTHLPGEHRVATGPVTGSIW